MCNSKKEKTLQDTEGIKTKEVTARVGLKIHFTEDTGGGQLYQ